ncbi:MAG TPA: uroporphyrinogen-III synthase [Terriglobales bacterium]|nr:uroporphyrinogen-III synthase [Terriglobales bacterium]
MTLTGELAGTRVLVGRAQEQAGRLSQALRQFGAEVVEIPFIEIRQPASWTPLDQALAAIESYQWLILTSVNGVEALAARMAAAGLPMASLTRVKLAAIGPATRQAIENHGLHVEVMPREYIAESVVEALRGRVEGARVLLVRARVARDVIPRELAAAGASVDVVEAYETIIPETSRHKLRDILADPAQRPHVITFTSSSTARNFSAMAGSELIQQALQAGIQLASIGPVTSGTLRELGLPVHVEAREYTIPGLVQAITEAISARK